MSRCKNHNSSVFIAALGVAGITVAYTAWKYSHRENHSTQKNDDLFPLVTNAGTYGILAVTLVRLDDTSWATKKKTISKDIILVKEFRKWNLTLESFDVKTIYCGRIITASNSNSSSSSNPSSDKNVWHGIFVSAWKDRDHFEQCQRQYRIVQRIFDPEENKKKNPNSIIEHVDSCGIWLKERGTSFPLFGSSMTIIPPSEETDSCNLMKSVKNDISIYGHEDDKNVYVFLYSTTPQEKSTITNGGCEDGKVLHSGSAIQLHHCSNSSREEVKPSVNRNDWDNMSIIQLASNKTVLLEQIRSKRQALKAETDRNESYKQQVLYSVPITSKILI